MEKFTYKLKYPVKHNAHTINELTIRRPTVGDQIASEDQAKGFGPNKQSVYFYARLSGLSPDELSKIDFQDWIMFL